MFQLIQDVGFCSCELEIDTLGLSEKPVTYIDTIDLDQDYHMSDSLQRVNENEVMEMKSQK